MNVHVSKLKNEWAKCCRDKNCVYKNFIIWIKISAHIIYKYAEMSLQYEMYL